MDIPLENLRTFAAAVDAGSLEAAARMLHITPSAVSQRIRAMEQRTGSVLLQRSRPVAVTEAGATVLRAARQIERIVSDTATELELGPAGGSLLPIVVNADSLATWFVPALARASAETGARFEVLRADETVSTERLRSGDVMAALTATADAVPGCTSTLLGVDRYHAVASPGFVARHFPDGITAEALSRAPMIEFDRHDMFQQRFIERVGNGSVDPPRHFIPSSSEFATAIELGMGWGMLPRLQCERQLADDRLAELQPGSAIDLPLYWQRWNLRSPVLDSLSRIVIDDARLALAGPAE